MTAAFPTAKLPVGLGIPILNSPLGTSPYMRTFSISHNPSHFSPFLISPVSEKTVFVVALEIMNNSKPPLAQIFNFTTDSGSRPILPKPLNGSIPSDIVYDSATGKAWYFVNDTLAYYDPHTNTTRTEYTFPNGSSPLYMTFDVSDKIWLTLSGTNQIAEYDPILRVPTYFSVPTANASLQGITMSPDGSIWFAEAAAKRIGHLVPCQTPPCSITDFAPPPDVHILAPIQVAVDRDGTVWFSDHGSNTFGSFNPRSNQWRVLPIGYCSEPYNDLCAVGLPNAMSLDASGIIWFSEHFAGRIARYDPTSGTLVEYIVPANSAPLSWWMSPGPGNLAWFVAYGLGEIGYVNGSVPVPLSLSASGEVDVLQSSSTTVSATIVNQGREAAFFNVSMPSNDAIGSSPLSYEVPSRNQIDPSVSPQSVSVSITAAWNTPTGDRYVAITAYNSNVEVNAFVKVRVTARVFLVQTFVPYLGLGLSSGVTVGTGLLYWRGRPKILPKDQTVRAGKPKTRRARSR